MSNGYFYYIVIFINFFCSDFYEVFGFWILDCRYGNDLLYICFNKNWLNVFLVKCLN